MLSNERIDPLFDAVIDATEEAILNALLRGDAGRGCATAHRLDPELLLEVLRRHGVAMSG